MVTMIDIAEKAGVSRATVSTVLNGQRSGNVRIPASTRQRVLDTAKELGYHRNELARSVRSGKSRMIGFVVPAERYEPNWYTILGALDKAEELGYTLKVLSVSHSTLTQRIQQAIELRLGGLVVRINEKHKEVFEQANQASLPVVFVDEPQPLQFGTRVAPDDAIGVQDVITHLIELGHHSIGFISSGFHLPVASLEPDNIPHREVLFQREMAARGLKIPHGFITHETMQVYKTAATPELDDTSAIEATLALLNHPEGRPSAIFCWRDETALVAIRTCHRFGLRVPQDISIVGFSDITAAQYSDPKLSTVRSPWLVMGQIATQQLINSAGGTIPSKPQAIFVPPEFVLRDSTGPA